LDGDRSSSKGKAWRHHIQQKLLSISTTNDNTDTNNKDIHMNQTKSLVILAMGGGEGVGSLKGIVIEIYKRLHNTPLLEIDDDTTPINIYILVVCGRNESLKQSLSQHDWTNELTQMQNNTNNPIIFA